ncbi:hypothetical protein V8G54_037594 [Vigna mungo]|uniref:Uncharacterized protein n=1 Tax=Vigna mungo TaxID=3915 RepID=A0AAQ3RHM9_VIGMU
MASSSSKRSRKNRKGKETLTESEDPTYIRRSLAEQLDQCRFFTHSEQMENYAADFYTRNIVVPKIMNFKSFVGSGLFFQHHLIFQGVVEFLTLQAPFYPDLIKVFYSNLKISGNGYLISEVHKRRIKLKPADWLKIVNMKYEGQKLCYSTIPDDFPYDREMTLATMEDIFMIWVLKNNIHHIMQHMLKCKAGDAPLPYDGDASTHIGTKYHFSIHSLKRLNIVNVNGVWQHDVGNDEEEQTQHDDNPVQPPPDLSNPNMMTQIWEGVQDLQHRMQGMEQMQGQVQRIKDNLANLSLDMNRQFAQLNQNLLKQEDYMRLLNDMNGPWSVEMNCCVKMNG